MTNLPLVKLTGESAGELSVSEKIFAEPAHDHVVHSVIVWLQAAMRQGTHSTKTKAEVRGGGRKPWKQKGTGRARAGSIRSPLWRKGGVVFGPKPRSYNYALPRKIRKLALRVLLSEKVVQGQIKVVEEFKLSEAKTKVAAKFLQDLGVSGKILLVSGEKLEIFQKSFRNLKGVCLSAANELTALNLIRAKGVVLDKSAVAKLEEGLK